MKKSQIYILLIYSILSSCSNEKIPQGIVSIPKGIWLQNKPLTMELSIPEELSGKKLDFLYQIAYSEKFDWENIWLRYILTGPDGDTIHTSTDNLFLFEPGNGKPIGQGPHERMYLDAYFLKDFPIKSSGTYKIKVYQQLRADKLNGILSLKVRAVESGK